MPRRKAWEVVFFHLTHRCTSRSLPRSGKSVWRGHMVGSRGERDRERPITTFIDKRTWQLGRPEHFARLSVQGSAVHLRPASPCARPVPQSYKRPHRLRHPLHAVVTIVICQYSNPRADVGVIRLTVASAGDLALARCWRHRCRRSRGGRLSVVSHHYRKI